MKTYILNKTDESGNVITGYEETIETDNLEEAILDYCTHHELNAAEVEAVEKDW